jgi:hypothetical protein
MSALFIPGSKRGIALLVVIGMMTGMTGVQQGHADAEKVTVSDLDLPNLEETGGDSVLLPEPAEDAYLRFADNALHGMADYAMWMYAQGYGFGQLIQFVPAVIVVWTTKLAAFASIFALFAAQLLHIQRLRRGER